MKIKIPVAPVGDDVTVGDCVEVEVRQWQHPDRIALGVSDVIPGEYAELLLAPHEAVELCSALMKALESLDIA